MQRLEMLESAIPDGKWEITTSMNMHGREQKGLAMRNQQEASLRATLEEANFLGTREKPVAAGEEAKEKAREKKDRECH